MYFLGKKGYSIQVNTVCEATIYKTEVWERPIMCPILGRGEGKV